MDFVVSSTHMQIIATYNVNELLHGVGHKFFNLKMRI